MSLLRPFVLMLIAATEAASDCGAGRVADRALNNPASHEAKATTSAIASNAVKAMVHRSARTGASSRAVGLPHGDFPAGQLRQRGCLQR
jgi:hypothetical protein